MFQELDVYYDTGNNRLRVGIIAMSGKAILFEYDSTWISRGIELAPREMPTARRSFRFDSIPLRGGLPGLFSDSLPDGWGLLVMDRFFQKNGKRRDQITPLDRLSFLGDHAMGALAYHPATSTDETVEAVDIGTAAREAFDLYSGDIEEISRLLTKIGGSPGGARPKGLVGLSPCGTKFVSGSASLPDGYSHWLIKFSSARDRYSELRGHEGKVEWVFMEMAKDLGIEVPEHRLVADGDLAHFAVKRFDRAEPNLRYHVATASGLLHADHTIGSLTYEDLIRTAMFLTGDVRQAVQQYRRGIFNFLAANRDDHAKNHGYILGHDGRWCLTPAYDMTYLSGPNGRHWTSVGGEDLNPSRNTLINLSRQGSIPEKEAAAIIDSTAEVISSFRTRCRALGIPPKLIKMVEVQQEAARKAAR